MYARTRLYVHSIQKVQRTKHNDWKIGSLDVWLEIHARNVIFVITWLCLFLRVSLQMYPACIPFVPYALCRMLQNFACLIEYITYSHVKYIYYEIYKLGSKAPFSEPNICSKCKQETLYRVWCMCWRSFVITFIWNMQVYLNSYIFLISWFNWLMKFFLSKKYFISRTYFWSEATS